MDRPLAFPYLKWTEPRTWALDRLAKLGPKPLEPTDAAGRIDLTVAGDDRPLFEYFSNGLLRVADEEELVSLYCVSREEPKIGSIRHQARRDHSPSAAHLSIHRPDVESSGEGEILF